MDEQLNFLNACKNKDTETIARMTIENKATCDIFFKSAFEAGCETGCMKIVKHLMENHYFETANDNNKMLKASSLEYYCERTLDKHISVYHNELAMLVTAVNSGHTEIATYIITFVGNGYNCSAHQAKITRKWKTNFYIF